MKSRIERKSERERERDGSNKQTFRMLIHVTVWSNVSGHVDETTQQLLYHNGSSLLTQKPDSQSISLT